jgi:hypothetical protein
MGRESRLTALGADNRGNRGRMVMAHGKFPTLLAADLRIEQQFRAWVTVQDQRVRDGPPSWIHTQAELDQEMAAIEQAEIEQLAGVLQAMNVPWHWCAQALVVSLFPIMRYNARHPHDQKVLQVSAPVVGVPHGRIPRHDGQDVVRDVTWWYRHVVKQPPDSISTLADEYAKQENRVTDARSVVQDGIKRAETLLNSVIPPDGGAGSH